LGFDIFIAQQPLVYRGLLITEASRSHSVTLPSVGLPWASDRPDAETSIWRHTTLKRDRHICRQRESNPQSQQESCLILRAHCFQRVS